MEAFIVQESKPEVIGVVLSFKNSRKHGGVPIYLIKVVSIATILMKCLTQT